MANIQERRDKSGNLVSYSIRVHRGRDANGKQLKPYTTTFTVSPTWTEKSARKKAEAFAAVFEKECKEGIKSDTRQTFSSYCDYVIDLKEKRGIKHSTIVRYRELTGRIYKEIGHIKLKDLRADHLNDLYTKLGEPGSGQSISWAKSNTDLIPYMEAKGLTRVALAEQTKLPLIVIYAAMNGKRIRLDAAEIISAVFNLDITKSFSIETQTSTLSTKTILAHHRLISPWQWQTASG